MRRKKRNSSMESDRGWLSCDMSETVFGWPLQKVTVPIETKEACQKSENDLKSREVEEDEYASPVSRPGWPLLRVANSETMSSPARNFETKISVVEWVMGLPSRTTLFNLQLAREMKFLNKKDSQGCRIFSYAEIRTATYKFSSENLIGEGGCSSVYRGILRCGKSVALKILKAYKEAWDDFCLEANFVSSIKHKHIASLIGVCVEDDNLVLVYELLPRGSLEANLHHCNDGSVLPWEVRFNVAVAVAEALNYLHSERSQPIIHRDVKSANILLSSDLQPQLSDFGLAIWGSVDSSYVISNDVVGTFGYMAPEYFMQGRVSDKVDVYAFGVVLLELLSGRKPVDVEAPEGQESLIKWARKLLKIGDRTALLDPKLKGDYDIVQMRRMSLAANLCTNHSAQVRPHMRQVLKLLRGETDANGSGYCEIEELEPDWDSVSRVSETKDDSFSSSTSTDTVSSSSSTDTASSAGKTPRFKLRDYLTIVGHSF
ncbi:protein kinase STUNTED-like [Argentina anserina]|uniref:protein kinase STUNTED-like n=1 Tax=Argentina anserina TaxID=57926 RepID=UPI002176784C|nr:protein kinase STUNTED-like [Potentilla anserina]